MVAIHTKTFTNPSEAIAYKRQKDKEKKFPYIGVIKNKKGMKFKVYSL